MALVRPKQIWALTVICTVASSLGGQCHDRCLAQAAAVAAYPFVIEGVTCAFRR